jgi:hypothetical protein
VKLCSQEADAASGRDVEDTMRKLLGRPNRTYRAPSTLCL